MSASRTERASCLAVRDDWDRNCAGRGHRMRWRLGENATRRGHAYSWHGRCDHCGAEMTVGSSWTSCPSIRDARKESCSGPATAVLTEIEADRASVLIGDAIFAFGTTARAALAPVHVGLTEPRRQLPTVTRQPRYQGYTELGGPNEPGEDYLLLADGHEIGGTYWCGAHYIPDGQRWASWGPAGLSTRHPSRESAEQVQVDAVRAQPPLPEPHDRRSR